MIAKRWTCTSSTSADSIDYITITACSGISSTATSTTSIGIFHTIANTAYSGVSCTNTSAIDASVYGASTTRYGNTNGSSHAPDAARR